MVPWMSWTHGPHVPHGCHGPHVPHGCHGTSWASGVSWVQGIIGTMGLMEFVCQYIYIFSVLDSKTKLWIQIHCHIVKQHKIYLF